MSYSPQTSLPAAPTPSISRGEQLIRGELTPAQYLGISQQRLYEIAALGHRLLSRGQLQAAMDIFKGLVAASPYDSVFHCNLAATYAQTGRFPEALEEYTQSLLLNVANVEALVGRSELLLREGKFTEALADIQLALRLDPDARRQCTQRARTTLLRLQELAEAAERVPGKAP
jgi:Flp pilus assembly protein TadD